MTTTGEPTLPAGGDTSRRLEARILKKLGVDPNKVITNTLDLKPIGPNGFIASWTGSTFVDSATISKMLAEDADG